MKECSAVHQSWIWRLIRRSIQHHSNKSNTLACVCTVTFRMHLFQCKLFSHETNRQQRVFTLQMMQEQTEDFNTSSTVFPVHSLILSVQYERWQINTSSQIKKEICLQAISSHYQRKISGSNCLKQLSLSMYIIKRHLETWKSFDYMRSGRFDWQQHQTSECEST